MTRETGRIPLTSPKDIPTHFESEDAEAVFWSSHELTPELCAQLPALPEWAEEWKRRLRSSEVAR